MANRLGVEIEVPLPPDIESSSRLLEIDGEGGVIRFAGQRALLFDAVAMGLLRQYLVQNFGPVAARAVLTQFGFAQGWRTAVALRSEMKWESDEERERLGALIPEIEGFFKLSPSSKGPLSPEGMTLSNSYEAEQHLAHFGRGEDTVCWTLCGLVSGYATQGAKREVYVMEDRCVGRGDAVCHFVGRTREEWRAAQAGDLIYFEPKRLEECLDVSLGRVLETLKEAERKLVAHKRVLTRVVKEVNEPLGLTVRSESMRRLVDLARRVAKVDSTVLITGESGVGKERIARLVHDESGRASGPFIAVNCGAISESLLESELFGHARGSFTGATQDRPGLFEAAHRGTLLLDEIGEVSPGMQVKLLRVLQEREVRRVGENHSRKFDVRVIAATNRDLSHGVADGGFRQDLYYRVRVVELRVPPLRERREDILPLARVLLADISGRMKRKISGFSPLAVDQIVRYAWPGNVRELENAVERAVALSSGTRVEFDDLPEEVRASAPVRIVSPDVIRPLQDIEKDYILEALSRNGGNQTRTAEQLRIGSATLYRKLKAYGMLPGQLAPG